MCERQHRASDTENSALRAELYRLKVDIDLKNQGLRQSEYEIYKLEAKLYSIPSVNSDQGSLDGRERELTNLLLESKRSKAISEDKAAAASALAQEM